MYILLYFYISLELPILVVDTVVVPGVVDIAAVDRVAVVDIVTVVLVAAVGRVVLVVVAGW